MTQQPDSGSTPAKLTAEKITQLNRAAEQGDVQAQAILGMAYANENGVELDYKKAFKWLSKAAEQQHPASMRTLAYLYTSGFGVEQNDEKARELCVKLAKLGDPKDQYFLATLYQTGLYGMEPDSKQMLHWYYQAAQQQYGAAQYALAKVILKGKDIERNEEMAFQWLSMAIVNGHEKAGDALRTLTEQIPQDIVEQYKQRMTEQIKQAMGQ